MRTNFLLASTSHYIIFKLSVFFLSEHYQIFHFILLFSNPLFCLFLVSTISCFSDSTHLRKPSLIFCNYTYLLKPSLSLPLFSSFSRAITPPVSDSLNGLEKERSRDSAHKEKGQVLFCKKKKRQTHGSL